MDMLENILSREVVHKLGWTLLHSLWQGGIVVLLLVVCLRLLRKSSANLRYVVAGIGLALIVLLPVLTFYVVPAPAPMPAVESVPGLSVPVTGQLREVYDTDMPFQRAAEYMQIFPTISLKQRAMNLCTYVLPYVVFGWFIGVLALSLWHLGGWVHLQRLRRKKVNNVDISLQGKLHNLVGRLKVTQPVKLMESALVQIPTVVGWLRPMILMPASALAGLSPEQLEALLAHELAHIRRYDYLVNMFQTVVEILGFYHPAVWWISHKIRVERENCCDDLAVSVCGDKIGYARALTSMEETRFAKGELAVAASGGSLSRRIRRLIGTGSAENNRLGYVPVVISILLIMALMIPTTLALTAKRENQDSSPVGTTESDSVKTADAYVAIEDQMNDSERNPAADLGKTDKKTQILFYCKIYEVPADLKFLEGEQKEDEVSPIVWLGHEYAERLESLSQKTNKAKKLATPRILALEGEEASMDMVHRIAYKAGYESTTEVGKEPKPIFKYLFDGIKLKLKVHTVDSSTISTEIRLTQSKTSFTTHKDSQGREIQIPVIASSACATDVTVPSQTPVVIGGLKSQNNDNYQLLFVITPSIVLPEKGPEKAKIEKEVPAVDNESAIVVDFPDAEKEKIKTDQRLAELQSLLMQDQDLKKALKEQTLELRQKLNEIQMKLKELETRKAESSELGKLNSTLASPKEPKSEDEPGYHTVREGDSVAVPSMVLDDKRIESEMAAIEAEINNLDAQLTELEAEIFNRQSECWAEMRAFTADVVAVQKSIVDANTLFERDFAALKKIEMEIKSFKLENGANIATDNALYNKLKKMTANRDELMEQIERDKAVLAKYEQKLKDAEYRQEIYARYFHQARTELNEVQHLIYLAKEALERQMAELKGLSSEHVWPKEAESGKEPRYHTVREGETLSSISKKYYGSENKWQKILDSNCEIITADGIRVGQRLVIPPLQASANEAESEHERLAAMADRFATRGDFAKAIEHLEEAIELARVEKDYGIGIAIAKDDGLIRIGQLLPDAPASRSSFRKGDIIKAIDGVSTEGMSLNEVVARIRGPKGTNVTLTVKCHSQNIIMQETFTRQLPLKGSPALQDYYRRLDVYEAGKTLPQYREMMKNYKPRSEGAVKIYEIKYANPEELAELLNRILERRWKGIKDKPAEVVKIVADPGHKKLIILASPADIQLIEALIAELDVSLPKDGTDFIITPRIEPKSDSSAEGTITQIIKLQYADCESVEQILIRILSDEHLKIATDKRTNMLIVAGTKSAIEQIKALVAEIDVPGSKKELEINY